MLGEAPIAALLDRRSIPKLAAPKLLFDVPTGAIIIERYEIVALEGRHRTIDRTLAPARDPRQRFLGGTAECNAVYRRQRAAQAANQNVSIGIVGDRQGKAPSCACATVGVARC